MKTPSQTNATTPGPQAEPSGDERDASGSSELKGARILLVEDSWHVGNAIKRLLHALGADVAGPAATIADAVRLVAERMPVVALVGIRLLYGELAYGLIVCLYDLCIPVVVITGS